MTLKNIFSNEFLEEYKAGKREFSNINLQYADISHTLENVIIKDSRLFFVTFRDCNFSNVKFINCELYYLSFYGGRLENSLFDNCEIDFGLADNTIFRNTKILKSKITWTAFLGNPIDELDLSTSTQFKVVTNISQITPQYMEEGISQLGPILDSLDISIRAKIKQELYRDASNYGIAIKETDKEKPEYGRSGSSGDKTSYGAMPNLADMVIGAYNAAHPYKTKSSYKDDNTTAYR